jgi:hypothetical protein
MSKIKWMSVVVGVALALVAEAGAVDQNVIYVGKVAPFSQGSVITKAVVDECDLPARQIEFIEKAAAGDGAFRVVRDDEAVKAGKGRILFVEIVNAESDGSSYAAHRLRQVAVKGRLLENGVEIGSFTGARHSRGGAFARYKSACVVLGRCIETLGKDIVIWLKKPEMNSRIGE